LPHLELDHDECGGEKKNSVDTLAETRDVELEEEPPVRGSVGESRAKAADARLPRSSLKCVRIEVRRSDERPHHPVGRILEKSRNRVLVRAAPKGKGDRRGHRDGGEAVVTRIPHASMTPLIRAS
jgi:hypothetical protein